MSRDEEQLIRLLLSYDAPAMKKRGLQNLCAALERGRQPLQREPMIAAIGGLKDSEDVKVRRWFYKAVALLRATDLLPQITYQVLFSETDPENVSWAVTALFSIAPPEHAARVVKDRKLRFFETHLELAAQLFTDGEPLVHPDGQLLLFRIENDPLTAKWFTLLFGYGRSDRREALLPYPTREVVSAFGRHHDPEVVEYSTWSLFRAQGTTDRDSALSCDDFFDRPSNVRRWHYPLLAKTTSSFRRNLEFFKFAIEHETDLLAKEGLALALSNRYSPHLASAMIDWSLKEKREIVRLALIPHFVSFAGKNKDYEHVVLGQLETHGTNAIFTGMVAKSAVTVQSAGEIRTRLQTLSRQQAASDVQVNLNFQGGFTVDNRNVSTTAIGGSNIALGSVNLGQIEAETMSIITQMRADAIPPGLKTLLEDFLKKVQATADLDGDSKAIVHSAVKDIAASSEVKAPEEKHLLLKKAIGRDQRRRCRTSCCYCVRQ